MQLLCTRSDGPAYACGDSPPFVCMGAQLRVDIVSVRVGSSAPQHEYRYGARPRACICASSRVRKRIIEAMTCTALNRVLRRLRSAAALESSRGKIKRAHARAAHTRTMRIGDSESGLAYSSAHACDQRGRHAGRGRSSCDAPINIGRSQQGGAGVQAERWGLAHAPLIIQVLDSRVGLLQACREYVTRSSPFVGVAGSYGESGRSTGSGGAETQSHITSSHRSPRNTRGKMMRSQCCLGIARAARHRSQSV